MDVKTKIITEEKEFEKLLKEKADKSMEGKHPFDLPEIEGKLRKKV